MTKSNLRRIVAGTSALTMAAGMAATIGMGAANAETVSTDTIDGKAMTFTRAVSGDALVNGAVQVGDQIQITNTVKRKAGWLLDWVNDEHPACLTHVPNTSTWAVSGTTYSNDDVSPNQKPDEVTYGPKQGETYEPGAPGWTTLNGPGTWQNTPLTWTQTYTVDCAPGTLNTGGIKWGSTGGSDTKHNVGPTITVKAADSSNGNGDTPGGDDGSDTGPLGSLGSLSGIFASLS